MKTKPHLAFSELTKRVYIVHGKEKEDVTDWIEKYYTEVSKKDWNWKDACRKVGEDCGCDEVCRYAPSAKS